MELRADHPFRAAHERAHGVAPLLVGLTMSEAERVAADMELSLIVVDDATQSVGASFQAAAVVVHMVNGVVRHANAM